MEPIYEVQRQLAVLLSKQDDLLIRMKRMEDDLDNKYQTRDVSDQRYDDNVRRIANLEETFKWVTRTVLGVVILAVLGTVMVLKKGGL